jgi:hypothetical protein
MSLGIILKRLRRLKERLECAFKRFLTTEKRTSYDRFWCTVRGLETTVKVTFFNVLFQTKKCQFLKKIIIYVSFF